MDPDDIIQSTKSLIQCLDTLKCEHNKILNNSIHSKEIDENTDLIRRSIDTIDLGINEAQLLLELNHHINNHEGEKQKLLVQTKRLHQENLWLRDELGSTQRKLHECQQKHSHYLYEIEHLKQVDNECDESIEQNMNEQDLIKYLFPFDEQNISKTNDSISINHDNETETRLSILHNLVLQYASQGRYEIVIPLCRDVLDDLERTVGHQHPDVATILNILALAHRDQSRFDEAVELLHEALRIREQTLGPNHLAVAATLNNLSVLYGKQNKFKEAQPLCLRALNIREKCLGRSHADVAKQLNNLALLCQCQQKYDDAEIYFKRAIDIYANKFGPSDVNVTKTKINLASAYVEQHKYQQAEEIYHDILIISYENNFGNVNEDKLLYKMDNDMMMKSLKHLCFIYQQQGQGNKAVAIENCIQNVDECSKAIIQVYNIIKQK